VYAQLPFAAFNMYTTHNQTLKKYLFFLLF
jgi:hypothetical protein